MTTRQTKLVAGLFWIAALFLLQVAQAWVVVPTPSIITNNHHDIRSSSFRSVATALNAGFGGGGGGAKEKKEIKLKPKQQWDRYTALKKETSYKVAVKPSGDDNEWLEVGAVRSQGSDKTEIAVARQRALIAEVRLQYY